MNLPVRDVAMVTMLMLPMNARKFHQSILYTVRSSSLGHLFAELNLEGLFLIAGAFNKVGLI